MGQAIYVKSSDSPNRYHIVTHSELDICDSKAVERYVVDNEIDTIINCAAYTDVERAEDHPELAYAINSDAVATLADVCSRLSIRLIHISTDYVFGGDAERREPYAEGDIPEPINIYGKSKAQGEREVLRLANGIIIRTSWLYAPWSKNFMLTILRLAAEQAEIRVVDDQRGTPTSAIGLAEMLVSIIDTNSIDTMSGIYHYTDDGECSWYDFAREIVSLSGHECRVVACSSSERNAKAKRPAYSVLGKSRIACIEGVKIAPWGERLREVINLINS